MPIDFHAGANRYSYAARPADPDWADALRAIADPRDRRVLDIGCGGGIYSRGFAELGARHVTGIDFSAQMVNAAREKTPVGLPVEYRQGDAAATGLPDACADLVFERALIHHLADLDACFREARRLLAPGGMIIVQDRTPDDVQVPASPDHLRGYFFELFPRLLKIEMGRRPVAETVSAALARQDFERVTARAVWETRRGYPDFNAFATDLKARTGRSILHELSDDELLRLAEYIYEKLPPGAPIAERDRWTVWHAAAAT